MSDLFQAAESYGSKNPDIQITVRPFGHEWMEKYGIVGKIQEIQSLAEEVRLSAYPDELKAM